MERIKIRTWETKATNIVISKVNLLFIHTLIVFYNMRVQTSLFTLWLNLYPGIPKFLRRQSNIYINFFDSTMLWVHHTHVSQMYTITRIFSSQSKNSFQIRHVEKCFWMFRMCWCAFGVRVVVYPTTHIIFKGQMLKLIPWTSSNHTENPNRIEVLLLLVHTEYCT